MKNPLAESIRHEETLNEIKNLLKGGAKMDDEVYEQVVRAGRLDILKILVDLGGMDINRKFGVLRRTLLFHAADTHRSGQYPQMIEYLIQKGAYINTKDSVGDTPLLSSLKRYIVPEHIVFIIERGNLSVTDREGNTPASLASKHLRENRNNFIREPLLQRLMQNMSCTAADKDVMDALDRSHQGLDLSKKMDRLEKKYPSTMPKGARLAKLVLMACLFSPRHTQTRIVCHVLWTQRLKLSQSKYPFHLLVPLVDSLSFPCWVDGSPFEQRKKSKLGPIVDHLISKGFDINAVEPLSKTTAMAWLQEHIKAYESSNRWQDIRRRLVNLRGIFVSRGATGAVKQGSKKDRPKRRDVIKKWTTVAYRNIQDIRRGVTKTHLQNKDVFKSAQRINTALAQEMRNTGLRAPVIPRKFQEIPGSSSLVWSPYQRKVKYLYRGIHGPLFKEFFEKKKINDNGYIAFSRSKTVARQFAKGNPIMRLKIATGIPRGTPWLWFHEKPGSNRKRRGDDMMESDIAEGEVLLPPGTIIAERVIKNTSMIDVIYTPDTKATTITNRMLMGNDGIRPAGSSIHRQKRGTERNNEARLSREFMQLFDTAPSRKRKRINGNSSNTNTSGRQKKKAKN